MAKIDTGNIPSGSQRVIGMYYTSLTDLTGIVSIDIDSTCANLTISDQSNFDVEKGHFRIDNFNTWRKLIVTNPDGTTTIYSSVYTASTSTPLSAVISANGIYSLNEADAVVINPDSGLDFTIPIDGGDGVYNLNLCQVPRWTTGVSYNGPGGPIASQDVVVESVSLTNPTGLAAGNYTIYQFYRCLDSHGANAGNKPSGFGNAYWERVSEDQLELTDGYDKYCDEEHIMVHCELDQCIANLSANVLCGDKKIDFCSSDPCCCYDEEYMALLKLFALRHAMDVIFAHGDYTYLKEIKTISDRICGCQDVTITPPDHPCLDKWVQGGPATGVNDQAYAGSSITTGEGTTVTDPSSYFVSTTVLYTGDLIKMPSGNIFEVVAGVVSCTYGCHNPESPAGTEHWVLCN